MAEESAVPAKTNIDLVLDSILWAIAAATPFCVGVTTLVDAQTPTDHAWGGLGILLGIVLTMWASAELAGRVIERKIQSIC